MKRQLTLQQLIAWGKGTSSMSATRAKTRVKDIWMDSRRVQAGDVFLALRTDTNDGHNYVGAAFKAGAVAAIVSSKRRGEFNRAQQAKLIGVKNPLAAVSRMAKAYRTELNIPIVGVTGSSGKTTTRRFIATALSARFTIGETSGNWNNHIGVPLTILRFRGNERVGVVELAANHCGEIAPLSRIAQPDIAVVTNIGYAHIGNFGSLRNTTGAKLEIAVGLPKKNGILVLNGDDKRLVAEGPKKCKNVVFFGMSNRCHVRATRVQVKANGNTEFSVENCTYRLPMPGVHFVYSALPAIFVARQFGFSHDEIAGALAGMKTDPLRGKIQKKKGVTFVVDCYNANPSSMLSGISLLKNVSGAKRGKAIVGDMLELGRFSKQQHVLLGKRLANAGVSQVIVVGKYADYVALGAVDNGMARKNVSCADNANEAVGLAGKMLKKGDTVLLKGSRGVKLETVIEKF